jgi:hypothetical protein
MAGSSELDVFRQANQWWLRNLDVFFAYETPRSFQLNGSCVLRDTRKTGAVSSAPPQCPREFVPVWRRAAAPFALEFPSAVESLYEENNTVYAGYFPAKQACGRAVLVLPHWNAVPNSYAGFCRYLNWLGFSALLVTLPYHGERKPRECRGAEYAVSPNIGRTIASARQGVIDTLCCLDWLTLRGYERVGIVGSSLGFGHAFMASALDSRLKVNVFNHCCSTVSDALWAGMPRYRAALESHVTQQELRECWSVINPISYFDRFRGFPKQSLLIVGRYDTTFARAYVEEAISPFRAMGLSHRVVELPCGHRTIGDAPYAILAAYHIGAFLKKSLPASGTKA